MIPTSVSTISTITHKPWQLGEFSMELFAHVMMNEVLIVVGAYFVGVVSGLALARGVWNR